MKSEELSDWTCRQPESPWNELLKEAIEAYAPETSEFETPVTASSNGWPSGGAKLDADSTGYCCSQHTGLRVWISTTWLCWTGMGADRSRRGQRRPSAPVLRGDDASQAKPDSRGCGQGQSLPAYAAEQPFRVGSLREGNRHACSGRTRPAVSTAQTERSVSWVCGISPSCP